MYSCQFKTGEIVINVETPEKLDVNDRFALFLSDGENADVTVKFEYADEIKVQGKIIADSDNLLITEDNGYNCYYYHLIGENDYYALRKEKQGDSTQKTVFLPMKYKGQLWTRVVFDLMGFEDIAAQHSAAVLHASVVEYNGRAILFTAPCGTGKSTQAELWRKYRNADVINGDKALIYMNDGVPYVSGLTFCGSSNICKNKKLPVTAIVSLAQAKENIIRKLTGLGAYRAIFGGCYHSSSGAEINRMIDDVAEKFAVAVPVVSFACLPDSSAVDSLESFLEKL